MANSQEIEPDPRRRESLPSWLWAPALNRIVSANRAALVFWDETSLLALADRMFSGDEPFLNAARRVAESGAPERLRLRFFSAPIPGPFICRLRPARTLKGEPGVLLSLEPPSRLPLSSDSAGERMSAALEQLPYAVLLARGGTVLAANRRAREIFGDAGATLSERLGVDAAQALSEGLDRLGWTSRSVALGPEAQPWHAEARRLSDPSDASPFDVVVLRDIAGVLAAEVQLAAERRELATLVQASCDFLWRTDAAGRLTVVSSGFERITGLSATRLLGKRWDELAPLLQLDPADGFKSGSPRVQNVRAQLIADAGKPPLDLALLAHTRFGTNNTFRGYLGVGRVIPAEPAEAPGSTLADAAGDALIALDPNALIREANRPATALLQASLDSLIGVPLARFLSDESRSILAQVRGPAELEVRTALGNTVRVRAEFRPLPESNCVGLALSDLRRTPASERALRRALEASEAANQKKSEFLAKVSHELRTPLNAIIGFAEIMRDERLGTLGNARYAGYVRDIHHSGQLLLSLINDLLDLSKVEAGRAQLREQPVELADVIGRAVNLLKPAAANAGVTLGIHLPSSLPAVMADERSVEQILLNLISNAVKFTESGGRVLVTAEADAQGGVTLGVRDTGVGMSDAELKVALEPFRRVERAGAMERPGTGLGLPLAKALAEANQAEFHIASAPKAGTSIEVRFPRTRLAE